MRWSAFRKFVDAVGSYIQETDNSGYVSEQLRLQLLSYEILSVGFINIDQL